MEGIVAVNSDQWWMCEENSRQQLAFSVSTSTVSLSCNLWHLLQTDFFPINLWGGASTGDTRTLSNLPQGQTQGANDSATSATGHTTANTKPTGKSGSQMSGMSERHEGLDDLDFLQLSIQEKKGCYCAWPRVLCSIM